nr:hypothetical protein [Sphingomonas ursincola]
MLPVLTIAAEGETRVPIAAEKIAVRLGLTEDEREEMLPTTYPTPSQWAPIDHLPNGLYGRSSDESP